MHVRASNSSCSPSKHEKAWCCTGTYFLVLSRYRHIMPIAETTGRSDGSDPTAPVTEKDYRYERRPRYISIGCLRLFFISALMEFKDVSIRSMWFLMLPRFLLSSLIARTNCSACLSSNLCPPGTVCRCLSRALYNNRVYNFHKLKVFATICF